MSTTERLQAICELLVTPLPSSILQTHPNDLFLNSGIPDEWCAWWHWAAAHDEGELETKWMKLVRYYNRPTDCPSQSQTSMTTAITGSLIDIPPDLRSLIDDIRVLQLDRSLFVPDGEYRYQLYPARNVRMHSLLPTDCNPFLRAQLHTVRVMLAQREPVMHPKLRDHGQGTACPRRKTTRSLICLHSWQTC